MEFYLLVLCLGLLSSSTISERSKRGGSYCYTPEHYVGLCVPLVSCPTLLQFYTSNEASPDVLEYLRQSHLGCGSSAIRDYSTICCINPVSNFYAEFPQPIHQFSFNPSLIFYPAGDYFQYLHPISIEHQPQLSNNVNSSVQVNSTINLEQTEVSTLIDNVPENDGPPGVTLANNTVPVEEDSEQTQTTEVPEEQLEFRANNCVDPDGKQGSCVALRDCNELITRLRDNPSDTTFKQFLRSSNKVCNANPPVICCPSENDSGITTSSPNFKATQTGQALLPTPEEGCGQSSVTHRKIVGGRPSQLASWPWIALLGYAGSNGIAFRCGGSLVTRRHVVTAAHCLDRNLRVIRLGEHDLATESETRHMDVNIVRSVAHPEYQRRNGRSDIAVIYLARDIQFTSSIGPICIPDKENFEPRSLVGYTPFVAGWGLLGENTTTSATVLQEVQLPVLKNKECENRYRVQNLLKSANQFDEAVLCAGVLSGGKDTCRGDSGGPLMLPKKLNPQIFYYNLIGVVSYGIGCARENAPGVYANVRFFSDWIKQKIAEPI